MINKLQFNDFELSYTTEGKGSDILLLHGFPSNMYMWNDIKKDLIESGYRVTIVEQRGYPLSRLKNFNTKSFNIEELSKDIEELIKRVKLDNKLTIVGHDWGSIVAWAVISREKININKLVSICGGTEFPTSNIYNNLSWGGKPHYITSFQNVETSANLINKNLETFFRSAYREIPKENIFTTQKDGVLIQKMYSLNEGENINLSLENVFMNFLTRKSAINESEITDLIKHFYDSSIDQPIAWYANIDLNAELSSTWRKVVTTPVHFIFGEVDAAVKLNDNMRKRLISSGTNVKITEIPEAGHWLPFTHKESVLREIYD